MDNFEFLKGGTSLLAGWDLLSEEEKEAYLTCLEYAQSAAWAAACEQKLNETGENVHE